MSISRGLSLAIRRKDLTQIYQILDSSGPEYQGNCPIPAELMTHFDPEVRWYTVNVLRELGARAIDSIETLRVALADSHEEIQEIAVRVLGRLAGDSDVAFDMLVNVLRSDRYSSSVRDWAAWELGRLGTRSLRLLQNCLRSNDCVEVMAALSGMVALGPLATEALENVEPVDLELDQDDYPYERGYLEHPDAPLVETPAFGRRWHLAETSARLEARRHAEVKAALFDALERVEVRPDGTVEYTRELADDWEAVLRPLVEMADQALDGMWPTLMSEPQAAEPPSLSALKWMGARTDRLVPRLLEMAESGLKEQIVNISFLRVLVFAAPKDESVVQFAVNLAGHFSPEVREAAVRSLAGTEVLLAEVTKRLTSIIEMDPLKSVRNAACAALVACNANAFVQLLRAASRDVRIACLESDIVGEGCVMRHLQITDVFRELLHEDDQYIRHLVLAVGQWFLTTDEIPLQEMRKALYDPNLCFNMLLTFEESSRLSGAQERLLYEFAGDPDPSVSVDNRLYALKILANHGYDTAQFIPWLLELLEPSSALDDPFPTYDSLKLLSLLGTKAIVAVDAIRALRDTDAVSSSTLISLVHTSLAEAYVTGTETDLIKEYLSFPFSENEYSTVMYNSLGLPFPPELLPWFRINAAQAFLHNEWEGAHQASVIRDHGQRETAYRALTWPLTHLSDEVRLNTWYFFQRWLDEDHGTLNAPLRDELAAISYESFQWKPCSYLLDALVAIEESALPYLIEIARDSEEEIRRVALCQLRKHVNQNEEISRIVAAARHDPCWDIRRALDAA